MVKQLIFTVLVLFSSTAFASGFVNVADDQAIRANGGEVVIVVDATWPEHILSIDGVSVDGEPAAFGESGAVYVLKDVDRGTHQLTLTTTEGEETITVHVLRVSQ